MKKSKLLILALVVVSASLALAGCSSGTTGSSIWTFIAVPLGYIMRWCYALVKNLPWAYVWTILLFTIATKLLLFPLAIWQQKGTARMSAVSSLMQQVQKTYAKDKNRQQQEMQKLQEEMGYNPLSGCLPMLVQFPIIFGLVEVIYKPLTYMLRLPSELLTLLTNKTVELTGIELTSATSRLIETNIIEQVKSNWGAFSELTTQFPNEMGMLHQFDMSIGSINLWEKPTFAFNLMLLIPLFSVVTMLISSLISAKAAGTQNQPGSGKVMMITMAAMFGVFSFTYPAGFSLYWGFQNIVLIFQSMLLRKMINPDKYKAEVLEKYEESKKKRKKKTTATVKLKDAATGEVVEKELSLGELEKLRLQKARELDEERYN